MLILARALMGTSRAPPRDLGGRGGHVSHASVLERWGSGASCPLGDRDRSIVVALVTAMVLRLKGFFLPRWEVRVARGSGRAGRLLRRETRPCPLDSSLPLIMATATPWR